MAHLRSVAVLALAFSACRIDPSAGPPFTAGDGSEEPGSPPSSEPPDGRGGASGAGRGGGSALPPAAGGGGAGGEGDEPPPGDCGAQTVTLDEVLSGAVLAGVSAAVVATATSQKFLVSQTQAGSCLWGAFVGTEAVGDAPRGLLVVSYGNPAPNGGRCEPGTDAVLDDLAPGDSVRIIGRASSFAPASCDGVAAAPQMIADARCRFERIERVSPLEPVALPLDVANELARGSDAELVARWAGALVRLENVSALPNESGDSAVRPYGVVALAETDLEIHADIEYGDLGAGGPRDPSKGLAFPYPTAFRSVTGLLYLDYCDYSLAPRRRCEDFDPPSAGCRPL